MLLADGNYYLIGITAVHSLPSPGVLREAEAPAYNEGEIVKIIRKTEKSSLT